MFLLGAFRRRANETGALLAVTVALPLGGRS
jgi:hypothetical protein